MEALLDTAAPKTSIFSISPTWGFSNLRDNLVIKGGASFREVNGEFELSTNYNANSSIVLSSIERGQYVPGFVSEAGVGIRIPNIPEKSAIIKWGYFDAENGFGFGVDKKGIFCFYRNSSDLHKVYQKDWNINPLLDELKLNDGNIYEIRFSWYGFGSIAYYIQIFDRDTKTKKKQLVHVQNMYKGLSIIDPNQPLSVLLKNNDEGEQMVAYVSSRQYSILTSQSSQKWREYSIPIINYEIKNNKEAIVGIRKRRILNNNRLNSLNIRLGTIEVLSPEPLYVYVLKRQSRNGEYTYPVGLNKLNASIEVCYQPTSDNEQCSEQPIMSGFTTAGKNTSIVMPSDVKHLLDSYSEYILCIQKINNDNKPVNVSILFHWQEQW